MVQVVCGDVDVRCEQRVTSGKKSISILDTCAAAGEPECRPHARAPRRPGNRYETSAGYTQYTTIFTF